MAQHHWSEHVTPENMSTTVDGVHLPLTNEQHSNSSLSLSVSCSTACAAAAKSSDFLFLAMVMQCNKSVHRDKCGMIDVSVDAERRLPRPSCHHRMTNFLRDWWAMTLCRFCTRIDGMGTKRMGKNLVLDFG
jgi:hypothetical protein